MNTFVQEFGVSIFSRGRTRTRRPSAWRRGWATSCWSRTCLDKEHYSKRIIRVHTIEVRKFELNISLPKRVFMARVAVVNDIFEAEDNEVPLFFKAYFDKRVSEGRG